MSEIVLEQEFDVSAARVFDALADQDNMSTWMGGKITVPVRGEAGLVGTVRRIHIGPLHFDERILEVERPARLAYQICSGVPLLARHRGEIVVAALGERKARATWRVHLALRPAFVGSFVRPVLRAVLAFALRRLARQLR